MSTLTPEAKQLLSTTIRGLREHLLQDIRDEAERRYHLLVPLDEAGLDQEHDKKRERIEDWLDEQVRSSSASTTEDRRRERERALARAVSDAAATFVTRLVVVRCLEATTLRKPPVVSGGWSSSGYREFRDFAAGLCDNKDEGYEVLLRTIFAELAIDLPGLFGDVGVTSLFGVPTAALRETILQLNAGGLDTAWTDDTTLGWIYQFWNDPQRKALDANLDAQQKLKWGDVASKTQLFTERYMVEWLLANSLGRVWRAICRKNGWLVSECTPLKYEIPHETEPETLAATPATIREVRLLDPACGSGHFLVIAFDMLVWMYREEARCRNEQWDDVEIVDCILRNNLHGVDIDWRAVQIAAAALYLKANGVTAVARPHRMNLVAPAFKLADLPPEDPSLARLCCELKAEVGIAEEITRAMAAALAGVEHLGTLLRLDTAVGDVLRDADRAFERMHSNQGNLFDGFSRRSVPVSAEAARVTVLERLQQFLGRHSSSNDLGLRLHGEQLSAGIRFVRIMVDGRYHVVVGNPPYFGTQALADPSYLDDKYPDSKENLCTAMFERATDLATPRGIVAFVTVRNWLYVSQLERLRSRVFRQFPPVVAADLGLGGFDSLPGVEVMMVVAERGAHAPCIVVVADEPEQSVKATSLACRRSQFQTEPAVLASLPGSPFVYRWTREFIEDYLSHPLLGKTAPVRVGMKTSDNQRFLRRPWELPRAELQLACSPRVPDQRWVPYVKGAAGKTWIEPLSDLVDWADEGVAIRVALEDAYKSGPQGEQHFFKPAVAFTTIGRKFLARAHYYPSIFDVAGSSVLPEDVAGTVCLLNSRFAREVVEALNPTINFQVGDVARIPCRYDPEARAIFERLVAAHQQHEETDERSPRFVRPGPSTWRAAQAWAQTAVDRPDGHPLPNYDPTPDLPDPRQYISFGVGLAMGRFTTAEVKALSLPEGILYLSAENCACLEHRACECLRAAWEIHRSAIQADGDLSKYLRRQFFDYHVDFYENRPIYFPISSAKKNFVAFISIHRWTPDTLSILLAEHLLPEQRRLSGEVEDIRNAPPGQRRSEKRFAEATRLLQEIGDFIEDVSAIATHGPSPTDDRTPEREADARYVFESNDGILVNSAALWPVLDPQWEDPKKWWSQLASRKGPKGANFDWSATARRYFPTRVEERCVSDPVLAAAHKAMWRLHPQLAYEWELRLARDVRAGFRLSEPGADEYRIRFLRDFPEVAAQVEDRVKTRRRGRKVRAPLSREEPDG